MKKMSSIRLHLNKTTDLSYSSLSSLDNNNNNVSSLELQQPTLYSNFYSTNGIEDTIIINNNSYNAIGIGKTVNNRRIRRNHRRTKRSTPSLSTCASRRGVTNFINV